VDCNRSGNGGWVRRLVRQRIHYLIKLNFPTFKRWLDRPTGNILEDKLGCSPLCVLGVCDLTALINLDDIGENGVNLLKRTRLAKDAGIINTLKQRMSDATVGNPE
jgi:hypothetical protein